MIIIVTGPQGAGKGTVASRLAKRYGWRHISAGELLRKEVASGSALGKRIAGRINKGKLVDDALVVKMLQKHVAPKPRTTVFLDGVPRDVTQARMLNKVYHIDCVLDLEIPDKVAIKRIGGRLECPKCGATYGNSIKPKRRGICDKDGVKLKRREDDTPAALKRRIRTYHERTQPVLKLYGDRVIRIDARGQVPTVMKRATVALKKCRMRCG